MRRSARLLLLAAGLAIIAVLVVQAGPALVLDMIARVGWRTVPVVAVFSAHQLLRALALWRTVLDERVRFVDVLTIWVSSESAGVLTWTGALLAEPAKGWLLARRGVTTAEAFGAVAAEFLLYATVSAGLTVLAFWLLLERQAIPTSFQPSVMGVMAIGVAFLVATAFAAITGVGLIVPVVRASRVVIGRSRAVRTAEVVGHVEDVLVSFLHAHPSRLAEVLAIECVAQGLLLIEIWVVFAAVVVAVPLLDPLIVEGGTKLIGWVFFFIPGQVGASEAAYVMVSGALGFPAAAGLTLALVRRVRSLIVAVAGLVLFAWVGNAASTQSRL